MAGNENLEICLGRTIMDAELLAHYEKSDPVFHYTSPEGLLGILQEDGPVLWFSQYDSLNDASEGVHIISVYQNVCDELLASEEINLKFYQSIHDVKPMIKEVFLYNLEQVKADTPSTNPTDYCKMEEAQKYICCFSKNRDSLPMWNYYTKGDRYEGYNIGFCFWRTRHRDVQDCYGKGYNFDLFTVIYDEKQKKQIIQDKIKELYSFYNQSPNEGVLARIKNILSYFLKALGLKFKQDCFQHEQEVRAILTVPKGSNKFKVEYRSKAGYIIPYIKIPFSAKIVSGITVGPLLNDQGAIRNIKQFVRGRHYIFSDTDIHTSKIPIRY